MQTMATWDEYLNALSNGAFDGVSDEQARMVVDLWRHATKNWPGLSLPTAGLVDDDLFVFAWGNAVSYCEFSIHKDGQFDWFCKDIKTGTCRGADGMLAASHEMIASLASFAKS